MLKGDLPWERGYYLLDLIEINDYTGRPVNATRQDQQKITQFIDGTLEALIDDALLLDDDSLFDGEL